MAVLSPKRRSTSTCHFRSISLLPRSHPATLKILDELDMVRSGSSHESIRSGIVGLEDLFEGVNGFLGLTSTQQAVSSHKSERVLNELFDASVLLLDACAATREAVSRIKEHYQDVRSAIQRSNPDSNHVGTVLSSHTEFKKKLRKDVRRAVMGMKRIENKFAKESWSPAVNHECDPLFGSAVTVLREAYATGASILQAVLSRLVSEKKSKGLVDLFKSASCEDEQDQLNDMEMGNIEDDLDVLYRKLIRSRAFLVNIFSL